eukprot:s2416_g9.t1
MDQQCRSSKKIATDFFIVRVNDTAPKKHQRLLTHAEFPRENRPTHPQRREDLKKFFSKIPKSEPSWSRFADFHLLLYIAKEIDVDTAVTIAECVRDRKERHPRRSYHDLQRAHAVIGAALVLVFPRRRVRAHENSGPLVRAQKTVCSNCPGARAGAPEKP